MNDAKISDLEVLLKSLEEKADSATPGPWVWDEYGTMRGFHDKWGSIIETDGGVYGPEVNDREFIAALNPVTVKKLIAVIRILENTLASSTEYSNWGKLLDHKWKAFEDCEKIVQGDGNKPGVSGE